MSRRLRITIGAIVLAGVAALAVWPPFLMPSRLYEIIYGWRYPIVRSCGDGTLTDRGPGASADRYVVDYGHLALGTAIESTLTLCPLPRDWMVLGLEYELQEEDRSRVEAGVQRSAYMMWMSAPRS